MKILVMSDTHIPVSAEKLPDEVLKYMKGRDLIIHAGDFVELSVFEEINKIAETKAVYGNMDSYAVKRRLPEKVVINAAGKKIGIIHGKGSPEDIVRRVQESFSEKLDIIVFGHSHIPFNKEKDGILFFNPGSVTDKVFSSYRSFGIIEITENDIHAEIIRID